MDQDEFDGWREYFEASCFAYDDRFALPSDSVNAAQIADVMFNQGFRRGEA